MLENKATAVELKREAKTARTRCPRCLFGHSVLLLLTPRDLLSRGGTDAGGGVDVIRTWY